jgi:DNA primase
MDGNRGRHAVGLTSQQIDEVRAGGDAVRVVSAHVTLQKKGDRYIGLCPFHDEKTPSFSVRPDKGLYYCFGCQAGGDLFSFVMRLEGLEFPAAVRRVAELSGVALSAESPTEKRRRVEEASLTKLNERAQAWMQRSLDAPEGGQARSYLQQRRIPKAVAQQFGLGFGGGGGALLRQLMGDGGTPDDLARAGLLTEDGSRVLFEGRLTFPIHDALGRLCGFGGRRLDDSHGPKYVNSKESALFSKRRLFFGWKQAAEALRRQKRAVLVEGYTDVIACHLGECTEAIAALGTAFSDEHARTLKKWVDEVVVLLDGDSAGQKAARGATEKLLREEIKVSLAILPEGEDPDSYRLKAGPEALRARIVGAQPAVEAMVAAAFADAGSTIDDRVRAASSLAGLFAAMGPGLTHDLYLADVAERVGVSVDQIAEHMKRLAPKEKRTATSADAVREAPKKRSSEPWARKAQGARSETPSARASKRDRDTRETYGYDPAGDAPHPCDAGPVQYGEAGDAYAHGGAEELRPHQSAKLDEQADFELGLLRELLLYPNLRERFAEIAEYSISPQIQPLWEALAIPDTPTEVCFASHIPSPTWVRRLAQARPATGENLDDRAARTFNDVLLRLKLRHLDAALKDVMREIGEVESQGGEVTDLVRRKRELSRRKLGLKRRIVASPAGQ